MCGVWRGHGHCVWVNECRAIAKLKSEGGEEVVWKSRRNKPIQLRRAVDSPAELVRIRSVCVRARCSCENYDVFISLQLCACTRSIGITRFSFVFRNCTQFHKLPFAVPICICSNGAHFVWNKSGFCMVMVTTLTLTFTLAHPCTRFSIFSVRVSFFLLHIFNVLFASLSAR